MELEPEQFVKFASWFRLVELNAVVLVGAKVTVSTATDALIFVS